MSGAHMDESLLLERPLWLQCDEWECTTMENRRKSGKLWQWPEPAKWQSYGKTQRECL